MIIISVIIPTYNRASLVVQTIESVLSQSFKGYEIIVVDDGSLDETRESLSRFSHIPSFRYIYQQNSGRSVARNYGIEEAMGEYLVFLDSDDLLFPDALSNLYMAARRNPFVGLVAGGVQEVDPHGNLLAPPVQGSRHMINISPDLYLREAVLTLGSFIVRKHCVESIGGFDRDVEPCEDYDFTARAVMFSGVTYIHDIILKYRKHDGNTDLVKFYPAGIKVAAKLLRLLVERSDLPAISRMRVKSDLTRNIADNYFHLNSRLTALAYYLYSVLLYPLQLKDACIVKQIFACILPDRVRMMLGGQKLRGASNG